MQFLTGALEFLILGWLFWPITVVFIFWAYFNLRDKDDFIFSPLFLLTATIAMIVYRYEPLKLFLSDWHNIAYAFAGYIIAGFVVAILKWLILIAKFRNAVREGNGSMNGLDRKFHFIKDLDKGSYLDWKRYSITAWWTYWPLYTFYIVLEPTSLLIKFLFKIFRRLFESLAQFGAIK